jgi:hypothetical protein
MSLAIENNNTLWLGTYNEGLVKMVGNYAEITNSIKSNNFNVYPNPSSGIINIDIGELQDLNYQLFDSFGREIKNGLLQGGDFSISIENLENGFYYLNFARQITPIKIEKMN